MKELLSNLVSNAVKYNRPGGQVWVNIREKDGNMVARVRDNGVGIPQESLDRIFERFYRVDKGHFLMCGTAIIRWTRHINVL